MVVCACHLCFVVMTMNHMAGTKGWQFSGLCCHGLSKESKISLNLNAKFHWLSKGSSSKHLYLKNPNSKLTPFLHYELHKKRRVQVLSSSIASPNTTLEFLTAYDDEYGGIIIDPQCLPSSANSFASALHVSLFDWKQKGKRGIWLKILLEQADLIPIAIQEGFNYHHTEPGYVMLTYWIPDEPCLLPASPSHHIGVGGFVINEQREILVVKEKGPCSCLGVWKFPTGYINKSEDIFSGVTREVREETGIDTTFLEIVAIRHAHLVAFEQSDLLFVCLLKPVSFDIIIDEKEIQAAKTYHNPLQDNPAYSVVTQYFVNVDDTVAQKIVVHKSSPRGTHFRRAGPRQRVYFESDEVHACIVTCGGLCPGLNTVIREIVCGLYDMYGVKKILGIEGGYRGFYARNTVPLTPKVVNDIHKRGGTILGTSRGGHDTSKIVDSIQDRGINQVYILGGDGTQKGASVIYEEIKRRGLKVVVAGIPKTIDNDIPVIDKSFGFDTAVEEAQRAINAAHVESESVENGIGVVKLMGRYSGFIAMYATLASRDVDCCLIPESPFYLEGAGGLFEFMEKRLKENGHMVIVIAEGAGQELLSESMRLMDVQDASGNKLLQDVGLWISQRIKDHFAGQHKMAINLKYIDPTYMIRAVPSNASDNVYCTLLAHSAIHGAMAGYAGFTVGPVNGRHAYIPFNRITEMQNKVVITDRMWARLLSSTNQPSFLTPKDAMEYKKEEPPATQLLEGNNCDDRSVSK